jgi:DNA-binding NtrC family response regulator
MNVHDDLSTIVYARGPTPSEVAVGFAIVVLEGKDHGKRCSVDAASPSRVLLGQSPVCTLRLTDPMVSRRHAALDVSGERLRIADLGSKNGTRVNDVAITEAFLSGGETIRIGATLLRVERLADPVVVEASKDLRFGRVVGASLAMRRLYPVFERLARSNVSVVLEGETGTGKEVLAESIHEASARAASPFVVFDCTAIPPNRIEAELFGYEAGAFPGATSASPGVFEQANGGTLFIDEIGELEASLQPKLLRVLERGEVRRIGGGSPVRVDVRVIASSRRNLDAEIQAGRFRDDLFFRLAVVRVELPPLRDRGGDVGLLARHFYRQLGGHGALPQDLLATLESQPFAGNVRELRNTIARRIALGDTAPLGVTNADARASSPAADVVDDVLAMNLPLPRARQLVVESFERRYIAHVLARYGGNVSRAADASGIARRYFNLLRSRLGK